MDYPLTISGGAAPERESTESGHHQIRRKPVIFRDAKTVVTHRSAGFLEKQLCDGPVLNLGDSCAFSCEYCYVGSMMQRTVGPTIRAYKEAAGIAPKTPVKFEDLIIRRQKDAHQDSIAVLRDQIATGLRHAQVKKVIYTSSTVDPAPNTKLLRETAAACNLILDATQWDIRILSKSPLITNLIKDGLIAEKHHQRIIFGFSIGTLDDALSKAIETGTPTVSKRLEALWWLQDHGLRTFGMICPSLPQTDYVSFSKKICDAIRVEHCEHVWAEVINVRGRSFTRTWEALIQNGYEEDAARIQGVSGAENRDAWESYARKTFEAHTQNISPEKLRFLQYPTEATRSWWSSNLERGAVLLGRFRNGGTFVSRQQTVEADRLSKRERSELASLEGKIRKGLAASIGAAKALQEIYTYQDGRYWKHRYPSFQAYCKSKWGYEKAHSFRLREAGAFILELEAVKSPIGDSGHMGIPRNESQIRPLLKLEKEDRVKCWTHIVRDQNLAKLTAETVATKTALAAKELGLRFKADTRPKKLARADAPARALEKFSMTITANPKTQLIQKLVAQIRELL